MKNQRSLKITHLGLMIGLWAILSFGLISSPLQAATHTVCPAGCNYTTMTAAITNAAGGDTIFVGPGTYNENITLDKNIQLIGAGADSTIIHGDNTASVVTINAGVVVTITGVTIENGAGNITLPAGAPTGPTDNSGRRVGGGVDNMGTLNLSHSLIQNNTVVGENGGAWSPGRYTSLGGGVYNAAGANLILSHVSMVNNQVIGGNGTVGGGGGGGFGGGIYNETGGVLSVSNSTISGNSARGGNGFAGESPPGPGGAGAGLGGGLFNAGSLTMTGTTFSGNSAVGGYANDGTGGGQTYTKPGGGGFGGDTICNWAWNYCTGYPGGFGGGGSGADYGSSDSGGDGGFGGGGGFGEAAGGDGGFGGGGAGANAAFAGSGGFGGGDGVGGGVGAGSGAGAGVGGAMFIFGGPVNISDTTIAGNTATGGNGANGGAGFGGGLFSNGVSVTLNNTILTGNTVTSGAGGTPVASLGPNCATGDGAGGSTAGGSFSGANNLESGTDCGLTGSGNQQNGNANLGSLSDNGGPTQTHLPGAGQARNTGSGCGSLDQRDLPRPQPPGGVCDKGAIEVATTTNAPVLTLPLGTRDYTSGDGVIVLESGATVGDADSSDFQQLLVNFSAGYVPGQDKLGAQHQGTGAGQIALLTIAGLNYVYYEGVVIGTYTASDSALNFTLNRNDTAPAIQALMRLITFENNSATPTAGTRTVAFALTDANSNTTTVTTNIIVRMADLHITKTVSPTTPVSPGAPITYTLTFSNVGNSPATGVIITDAIPVSVTNTSVVSSGVAITATAYTPAYVWQVQDLEPDETGLITITGILSNPLTAGTFTNTVEIATTSNETTLDNNQSQASLTVISTNSNIYLPLIIKP